MTDPGFRQSVQETKQGEQHVLLTKHADYGPYNIARAPGGPLMGLTVRLYDKICRLQHLLEQGVDPQNETLADTLLDIANYGTIGQMVCKRTWPGLDRTDDDIPEAC